jgi:hypothetical protein
LTNTIPLSLALTIVAPISSLWQIHLMFSYKAYIEIAGHSGTLIEQFFI